MNTFSFIEQNVFLLFTLSIILGLHEYIVHGVHALLYDSWDRLQQPPVALSSGTSDYRKRMNLFETSESGLGPQEEKKCHRKDMF